MLSAATEEYDRGEKREHYQQIASLQAYVLVAQGRRRVEVFSRTAPRHWEHRAHEAGHIVEIASLGVSFSTDELYEAAGLTFH